MGLVRLLFNQLLDVTTVVGPAFRGRLLDRLDGFFGLDGQWNVPSFRFLNTPTKLKDVYCLERSLQDTALVATQSTIPAQHAQRSCPG